MTYKYMEVRRDIYEHRHEKTFEKYRRFSDVKKLFNQFFWIILGLIVGCLVACFILLMKLPNTFYWTIPLVVMIAASIIHEYNSEKFYNKSAREEEIEERSNCYEEYMENIKSVLASNGLLHKEQWKALKTECEYTLAAHNKMFNSLKGKVVSTLISVPIGALISAMIYKNGGEAITQIICLIILGAFIISLLTFIRVITYYIDGHFKDQYLLDALNELEYADQDV